VSRRRYISTELSVDKKMRQLSDSHALFWTWMIPHAADDATITADPDELAAIVVPNRPGWTIAKVASALEAFEELGLIVIEDGTIFYHPETFYRYQSNVPADKRRTEHPCKSATREENSTNQHKTAQISASPSPSPSPSPSLSLTAATASEKECLGILAGISGFPKPGEQDLALLREPRDSRVDIVAEAKGYRDWIGDQRHQGKRTFNFRSSWRNRLNMAEKIVRERNGPQPAAHVPFDEAKYSTEDCVPMPDNVKAMFSQIGRGM
jgi:hypothetical protein